MSNGAVDDSLELQTKEAVWISKKKRFSTVWIVPIVALLIGLILIINDRNNRGAIVEISFKSAAGIMAEKSIIKYKDIEVGKVLAVDFAPDLKSVIVKAEIKKSLKDYLSENTKFWIVHARLGADSVEGLDTLLSGSYIGMYPAKGKKRKKQFEGLKEPPVVVDLSNGLRLTLEAKSRGSIQVGSPIYYKKMKAGSVIGYHLSDDGTKVFIDIFIQNPYSKLVTKATKFWESSGIRASISGDGVDITTESLTAMLSGGISFGNFSTSAKNVISQKAPEEVQNNTHFVLYSDQKSAKKVKYTKELYFWLYFSDSIRGLKEGAPVEFRGVKIGEVVDFFLVGDKKDAEFKIPILIKIEPERFLFADEKSIKKESQGIDIIVLRKLVKKGLRAQLQTISLLTGELFVNLDFHKDSPEANITQEKGLYVLPTVPATIETLKSDIQTLLDRLARVPFEEIGKNLNNSIEMVNDEVIPEISKGLKDVDNLIKNSNITLEDFKKDILPKLDTFVANLNSSIDQIKRSYINKNSRFNTKILRLLDEITRTTKSIKSLVDYLQRHPDSILKGK
jgi:paraquat-inducible protein B